MHTILDVVVRAGRIEIEKLEGFDAIINLAGVSVPLYRRIPKFWTHRTKVYYFCDTSVLEKAWRSRKRAAQAT
jgi:hypothetical protein